MSLFIRSIRYDVRSGGIMAGKPCIEVQFVGCNLKCLRCYKKDTWDKTNKYFKIERYSENRLIEKINEMRGKHKCDFVVFTGGEPALQINRMRKFYKALDKVLFEIQTNGTVQLDVDILKRIGHRLVITIAPKFKWNAEVEKERLVMNYHLFPTLSVYYKFNVFSMEEVEKVKSYVEDRKINPHTVFIEDWPYLGPTLPDIIKYAKESGFRVSWRY